MEFDTIAAISTPMGEGAIAIVRLSGDEAIKLLINCLSVLGEETKDVPSHTIHYGHIVHPETKEIVEEVMVTVMRAPKRLHVKMLLKLIATGGLFLLIACFSSC